MNHDNRSDPRAPPAPRFPHGWTKQKGGSR
jgi:hypothetical protein